MYPLTVIYNQPTDPVAFDEHYETKHVRLVKAIPGVERFSMGRCESLDGNLPAAYAIATLTFTSKDACAQALGSDAGQAAAGDVPNFASGGATMYFVDETTTGP